MKFTDEQKEIFEAIKKGDNKNWMLVGYDGAQNIRLVGSGNGGYSELVAALENDHVNYGIFRVAAMMEGHESKRTKFVFVCFVSDQVKVMEKARVAVSKGEFEKFFHGFHCTINASAKEEFVQQNIEEKLTSVCGAHKPSGYEF